MCGLTMDDVEAVGGVKFDFLGVKVLDKLMESEDMINEIS